jgi:holo-[acyl-carrier protein] synthase
MPVRVGVDLVLESTVRDSIRVHGDRYLKRIYTDRERHDCRDDAGALALRFAAKEAAMKALGREAEALAWRAIEVRIATAGAPELMLSGEAATLAQAQGVRSLSLSLTRARGSAAAVVLAEVAA